MSGAFALARYLPATIASNAYSEFYFESMKISSTLKFLCKWIAHPKSTGAVCPSSGFLARKMVEGVGSMRDGGVVVELGAGTGAVTKYLVEAGFDKNSSLYSIEFDSGLAETLKRDFPSAKVVNDSAENIRKIVGSDLPKVYAIVSSLPLLSLPCDMVGRILKEVEETLPAGGRFVQYTYNLKRNPNSIGFKNMRHIGVSKVYLNIPPARVDVFEKI